MSDDALTCSLVNRKNVVALMNLSVRDEEKHLISPNAKWLAQAPHVEESETYGIFHKENAVGLFSIIDPLLAPEADKNHFQPNCLYVWRLMIDQAHRGQAHGSAAITFVFQLAKNKGKEGVSLTTMDKHPGNALPFYETLGFTPTGRRLDDEIELVYKF